MSFKFCNIFQETNLFAFILIKYIHNFPEFFYKYLILFQYFLLYFVIFATSTSIIFINPIKVKKINVGFIVLWFYCLDRFNIFYIYILLKIPFYYFFSCSCNRQLKIQHFHVEWLYRIDSCVNKFFT